LFSSLSSKGRFSSSLENTSDINALLFHWYEKGVLVHFRSTYWTFCTHGFSDATSQSSIHFAGVHIKVKFHLLYLWRCWFCWLIVCVWVPSNFGLFLTSYAAGLEESEDLRLFWFYGEIIRDEVLLILWTHEVEISMVSSDLFCSLLAFVPLLCMYVFWYNESV